MNLASIWKWGCFRLRNAGTTARAGGRRRRIFFHGGDQFISSVLFEMVPFMFCYIKITSFTYFSMLPMLINPVNTWNNSRAMILRSKNEKINKKLAEGLPQGQNGTLKLSRKLGVFGQLESALYDRCSYFKTMDIVKYDLFHCK